MRSAITVLVLLSAIAPALCQTKPVPHDVWAARPVKETAYVAPNRLIWRVADLIATHKGQPSWHQDVVHNLELDAAYIQMAPGEKTKTLFYADTRVMEWVKSGQMRVSIEGQAPFIAAKGFLVDIAAGLPYALETVGDEPVLRFEVRPSGQLPSYPLSETPAPVAGWVYEKVREEPGGDNPPSYDAVNKPVLDFDKEIAPTDSKGGDFIDDGQYTAHMFRGPGAPTPPDTQWGHFHAGMAEFWLVVEGRIDLQVSGEKLVTGEVGDVLQAPPERWHRTSFHDGSPATRLSIMARWHDGQMHFVQEPVAK